MVSERERGTGLVESRDTMRRRHNFRQMLLAPDISEKF